MASLDGSWGDGELDVDRNFGPCMMEHSKISKQSSDFWIDSRNDYIMRTIFVQGVQVEKRTED